MPLSDRCIPWHCVGALLALAVGSCAPQPHGLSDAEMAARLGPAAPLLPLYKALGALEARTQPAPVTLLQIGDSHTANDSFSGRMREQIQVRFGDAGRGVLPPGIPYRYYRPARVSVSAQGWTVMSSFRSSTPGPFGISGLRQHTDDPAVMTLSADPADLARVEVEVLLQPGGGTLLAGLGGGTPTALSTNSAATQIAWLPVPAAPGGQTLTVSANGDGPVDVLSWSMLRGTAGVTYANLGTIGASVDIIDRWDPTIVRQELAHLAPALIVLAFGTNEGFRDSTDPTAYADTFTARLRELHADAPGAALLVLGPPDGDRHRRKGSSEPPACADPNWVEPPRLAELRAVQRQVAAREGAYFWDWQAAMGGACSMLNWAATVPPYAAPDHVHLYAPGYQATAEVLFRTIMEGYDRYRTLRFGS